MKSKFEEYTIEQRIKDLKNSEVKNDQVHRLTEWQNWRECAEMLKQELEQGLPFGRHVESCDNHDGSGFRKLSVRWQKRAEKAIHRFENLKNGK